MKEYTLMSREEIARHTLALAGMETHTAAGRVEASDYLEEVARSRGLTPRRRRIRDHRGDHDIVEIEVGPTEGPVVGIFCHIDTLPPETNQVGPKLDDDRDTLWGRGTYDMHGPDLIVVDSLAALAAADVGARLRLVQTDDEEQEPPHVITEYIRRWGQDIMFAMAPEPGPGVGLQARGALEVEIWVGGREAHAAYPQLGSNAIDNADELWRIIKRMPFARKRSARQPAKAAWLHGLPVGPRWFTAKPRTIAALGPWRIRLPKGVDLARTGVRSEGPRNRIPASIWLRFTVRFLPGQNGERIAREIRQRADAFARARGIELRFVAHPPFPAISVGEENPYAAKYLQAARMVGPVELAGRPGCSDISLSGIPGLEDNADAGEDHHGPRERVSISGLERLRQRVINWGLLLNEG